MNRVSDDRIRLLDKEFEPYLAPGLIHERVEALAREIEGDLDIKNTLCIAVLNGAFVFAADLIRAFRDEPEISFIKLASYAGTQSTGKIRELIGINERIKGRHVLIIEDIVDTGNTLEALKATIATQEPASVHIATLLVKPDIFKDRFPLDYAGFAIPNKFVVGYGLDYNGYGRGLKGIYQLAAADSGNETSHQG